MKQEIREQTLQEVLALEGRNLLFEMSTGYGKSRLALEKAKQYYKEGDRILIVINRLVHIDNWRKEILKWWPESDGKWTFVTYVSFPRHSIGEWDFVIFDECHHLSERCLDAIRLCNIHRTCLLSATVSKNLKYSLNRIFKGDLLIKTVKLREAIDSEVLPDPKVYLIPLTLRNNIPSEYIWKNKKSKKRLIECSFAERWQFIKQKEHPVRIYCTEAQYLFDLNAQIEYWKRLFTNTRNEIAKNKWLRLCNDRLRWLSDKKVGFIQDLLKYLKNYRTLTFCNSIEQTEKLGKYCINSKNEDSVFYLDAFNEGKIKHITACNMLNESMNLVDCKVGIYANLNNSDTIVAQRAGRLLRHPNPIIIIPYYKGTREEELVKKMLENYNPELVETITDIKEIK